MSLGCRCTGQHIVRFLLFYSAVIAVADPPPGYYSTAEGLSGPALKNALHNIIKNHTVVSYTATEAALKVVDEDPNNTNNVLLHYKGTSVGKSSFGSSWNREHLWPQSLGADVSPKKSDLHHLFAEDVSLNSSRGNSVFDVVYPNHTGSGYGNYWTSTKFEPRDAQKGDVARALFYMDVRYDGTGGESDLKLMDTASPAYGQMGVLSKLLQWHNQDPPDANERARNDKIYSLYQHNRNPFIDRPEFANLIWAPISNGDAVSVSFMNRATSTVPAGAVNYPVVSFTLTAGSNEWDLASVTVRNIGTLPSGNISQVRLYRDLDQNGAVSASDTLLASGVFSGAALTLNCGTPSRVTTTPAPFLIAVTLSSSAGNGQTLQLQVDSNSLIHSATGGNDINPTFSAFASSVATVTGGVTNGDVLNVTFSNLAPTYIAPGQANIPFIRIQCSAGSNEWDLASVGVAIDGTMGSNKLASVELYRDANSNNVIDTGDELLASAVPASSNITLTLATPLRITTIGTNLLLVASFPGTLVNGNTIGLSVVGNTLQSSTTGGNDSNPSYGTFSSSLATVTGGVNNGDSLSVTVTSVAPPTVGGGSTDVALLAISLTAAPFEWDVDQIVFAKSGTCPDSGFVAAKLYLDGDNSQSVSAGDVLLDSAPVSSTISFGLGSLRITGTPTRLLFAADLSAAAPHGTQFQITLAANGITHAASGGDDIDPILPAQSSTPVAVQNASTGSLKIVMLSTRGSDGAAAKEFIVLANHSSVPISLTSWQLRTRGGGDTTDKVLNLTGTVPAYGHFLIASQAYGGTCEGKTADFSDTNTNGLFGGMSDSTGRSLAIMDSSGNKVDGISFLGGATNPNNLHEGTAFTGSAGSSTVSVRRKRPGNNFGPYQDTDNNANDLENVASKTPYNSSDVTIGPGATVEGWSLY
ncbi:MAG: endonuclease [Candidatus Sumerlaeaceae bacterium]|nr:endonuclease [Candidatus Sumerlaeaceae bacterium]